MRDMKEASLEHWKAVEYAVCLGKIGELNRPNFIKLGDMLSSIPAGLMLSGINKLVKIIQVGLS